MAAWRAVVVLAALTVSAAASPSPCGQPGFIGLASTAELTAAGDLLAALTLTDAPVASLSVLPRVFVDGLAVDAGGPLRLACGEEVAWSVPAGRLGRAEHAVHWTVLPWPPVAPAVAALDPDTALARYAERPPPGLYPWSGVEVLVPPGATPWPRETGHGVPWTGGPGARPVDDAVEWLLGEDPGRLGRLARAPVDATLRFVLHYLPGELGAGTLAATCLLDGAQVPAFDGEPFVVVETVTGRSLVLEGTLVVPRAGWQRLQCLLLATEGADRAPAWPRPLLAAYLWGDP